MRYLIKLKLLFAISLIGISSLSLFTLTSCKEQKVDEEAIYKFIYERSFSIARVEKQTQTGGGHKAVFGTGWLISHIADYKYLMFTNWHVKWGQENKLTGDCDYYCFWTNTTTFGSAANLNLVFAGFEYKGAANYYYIGNDTSTGLGVDAAIAEVNFGSDSQLKSRLDLLNEYANSHQNSLIPIASSPLHTNDRIYMAGYPVENWANELNNPNKLPCWYGGNDKIYEVKSNFQNKTRGQSIDSLESHKLYSIADKYALNWQYVNDPDNTLFNMGGGASGSLALNKNEELIGLYWGGYTNGTYFSPSIESFFSFKNTPSSYSLYSDYLNGIWK